MKGDTINTKYFGTYIEHTDKAEPAEEIVGVVRIKQRQNDLAYYLYTDEPGNKSYRYDIPPFMAKYDKQRVAVLARRYQKQVGEKLYNKLIVIAVRVIKENN